MKNKMFKLGLVCGRFSHEQLGHVSLFEASLSLAEKTLILVGSAQESKTLRNPFTVDTRIKVIKSTFPDKSEKELLVKGIDDLTNEYDLTTDWGEYIKKQVEEIEGRFADLIVYGNEESKEKWFNHDTLVNTAKLILSRNINTISATKLRGMLLIGNKEEWKKETHSLIHNLYDDLRNELLDVPIYKHIYDTIYKEGLTLDNFMNMYLKLEEEDKKIKLENK